MSGICEEIDNKADFDFDFDFDLHKCHIFIQLVLDVIQDPELFFSWLTLLSYLLPYSTMSLTRLTLQYYESDQVNLTVLWVWPG